MTAFKDTIPNSNSNDNLNQLGDYLLFNTFTTNSTIYKKIPGRSFFKFIFYQFYKYFLFVSVLLFAKYTYYEINILKDQKSPLREFIKQSFIDKATTLDILGHVFIFTSYLPSFLFTSIQFNPFELVLLEISFFIFFSLVIFIAYKKNCRLDLFLVIIFFLALVGKWITFHVSYVILNKHKYLAASSAYSPSKDFLQSEWNFLRSNPIFRCGPFIIGIFFGLINYTIQKAITEYYPNTSRKYLFFPIKFMNFLSKYQAVKLIIFTLLFITVFIWNGFAYKVLFKKATMNTLEPDNPPLPEDFYTNYYINIYYLYDMEIMVFITFLALMPYAIIGENPIVHFLRSNYWNILSRPYYSFLLLIWGIINNVIYQTDTRINISFNNIIHYSVVNLMFGIIICDIFYALYEIPLKKLTKLIFKPKQYRKKSVDEKKDS